MLSMRSHFASFSGSGVAAVLHRTWRSANRACSAAAGAVAVWACIFMLTIFAWLPAMHARTHTLQHAAGAVCSHAKHGDAGTCNTNSAQDARGKTHTHPAAASPHGSLPADHDCDICSQLLLALLCGAVPSLDPPLPVATLAERIDIAREAVSARELAHLPPSRGPPVM